MSYFTDPVFLALTFAILLLGGGVKGVIGLGLPLISVPLLAYLMPVPAAISVLAAPVLVANTYQALKGGLLLGALRRFWPLLVSLTLGVALGAQLLIALEERTLYLVLGVMVVLLALVNLFGPNLSLDPAYERPAGFAVGLGSGVLGGVSSFLGPPVVLYLVSLHLTKDLFVVAIALVFLLGGLPLYGTLAWSGMLGWDEALLSLFAVLPVMLGLFGGQQLRRIVPQRRFHQLVLLVLVVVGISLVRRGLA